LVVGKGGIVKLVILVIAIMQFVSCFLCLLLSLEGESVKAESVEVRTNFGNDFCRERPSGLEGFGGSQNQPIRSMVF